MHDRIGPYGTNSIVPVAAFDIDRRKVGRPLEEAVFANPNCARVFQAELPGSNLRVMMGPEFDGVAAHMEDWPEERAFRSADARLPILGDDIKSQLGATIVHRALSRLFADRGVRVDRTYQLNTGGNTDFLNMLERSRLCSKKVSKTESVQSQLDEPLERDQIHIGPSDYVPWQQDNKICFIRIEGGGFGGAPIELELRLSVQDSPNSAGCGIDAIRCAKLGLDRGLSGPLIEISAYTMKHPPVEMRDSEARERLETFLAVDESRSPTA